MGTHTCIVSRTGSNASDTSTAAAFAWQVGAGSGTNPVNAADFPGGVFPSGTGTVAAGAASATITFQSNPDATFEPDETAALTVTTTQNGVTIIGSPQPFTINNDDTDPGGSTGPNFGPASTADTGPINTGSPRHTLRMTPPNSYDWVMQFAMEDADGFARLELVGQGSATDPAGSNSVVNGFYYNSDGVRSSVTRLQHGVVGGTGGKLVELVYRSPGNALITVGGVVVHDGEFGFGAVGNYARIITGGAAAPDAQITAN